jgi:hypothetical protein
MARSDSAAAKPAKPVKQKKQGRLSQIRQIYTSSKVVDPSIGWWVLGTFLGVLVVAFLLGKLAGGSAWVYAVILGLPTAFLAALIVLSRRAERAAYRQIEGQPGAAGAALSALRRGWYVEQSPVAIEASRGGDPSSAAMVFRAVGRPGVVLIGEGPKARSQKLLAQERKRIERVAPGVPVHALRIGEGGGEDEVPIRKVSSVIQRKKPALTKAEVAAVNKRLKALGGVKPPIPPGMDPNRVRMDRKALRGR